MRERDVRAEIAQMHLHELRDVAIVFDDEDAPGHVRDDRMRSSRNYHGRGVTQHGGGSLRKTVLMLSFVESHAGGCSPVTCCRSSCTQPRSATSFFSSRSEEHTSEL